MKPLNHYHVERWLHVSCYAPCHVFISLMCFSDICSIYVVFFYGKVLFSLTGCVCAEFFFPDIAEHFLFVQVRRAAYFLLHSSPSQQDVQRKPVTVRLERKIFVVLLWLSLRKWCNECEVFTYLSAVKPYAVQTSIDSCAFFCRNVHHWRAQWVRLGWWDSRILFK